MTNPIYNRDGVSVWWYPAPPVLEADYQIDDDQGGSIRLTPDQIKGLALWLGGRVERDEL